MLGTFGHVFVYLLFGPLQKSLYLHFELVEVSLAYEITNGISTVGFQDECLYLKIRRKVLR